MFMLPKRYLPLDPAGACSRAVVGFWLTLLLLMCLRAAVWPQRNTVYPIYSDAGQSWMHGANLYDQHYQLVGLDQHRYSPTATLAFVPLSFLPDAVGGVVWRLVNMTCFFAGCILFFRMLVPGREHLTSGVVACLGLLLIPLSLPSLNNGQANPLIAGTLLLAIVAVSRQQWNWATLALTVAILFKIYPLAIALLLLLLYPRQLGWRLTLALGIGALLPYLCQHADYVTDQYQQWCGYLRHEDRRDRVITESYKDFYLLTRWVGLPMTNRAAYLALQLLVAAGSAAVVVWGRWRNWPRRELLGGLLDMGCCWMLLFGPATENSTYILLAPTFACAVWGGFAAPRPVWTRGLLAAIVGIVVANALITALPGGRDWTYPLNPLATLLLFAERVLSLCLGRRGDRAGSSVPIPRAQAA
jgi:hypothetical protein